LPLTGFAADRLFTSGSAAVATAAPRVPQAHDVARRATASARWLDRPHLLEHVAATRLVSNCLDSGGGSLRAAANVALDGDLIDMTSLTCSMISLTTGQINLTADNVTLAGPAGGTLTINASHSSRLIAHTGHGVLGIYDLYLKDGSYSSSLADAKGGCVYSAGSISFNRSHTYSCVVHGSPSAGSKAAGGALSGQGYVLLDHSQILFASAIAPSGNAIGGGIYGRDVYLLDSSVTVSRVTSPGHFAHGGGIYARGNAIIDRSTISHCYAGENPYSTESYGGGAFVRGSVSAALGTQITRSTISQNRARNAAGLQFGGTGSYDAVIKDSTISGNVAAFNTGGIDSGMPMFVYNSTIAFNTAGSYVDAVGLQVYSASVDLQSSIIANNYAPGARKDFDVLGSTASGSNNLITVSSDAPVGTLTDDPQLNALAYNGGPTATHSLKAASPAIGHGNNVANLAYDQRGPTFPRVVGGSVDIGAVEFRDFIFVNGFESNP
jgi:hypothetical protein